MSYNRPRPSPHTAQVKRSRAGLGLFATTPVKKGDFIIEYAGPVMNEDEADTRGGKYQFAIDDKWTIDGSSRHNLARYINHSCRPNCEPEVEGRRVFIYAIKNIKPGDELTYDYGQEYFNDLIKPHGCKCDQHAAA